MSKSNKELALELTSYYLKYLSDCNIRTLTAERLQNVLEGFHETFEHIDSKSNKVVPIPVPPVES